MDSYNKQLFRRQPDDKLMQLIKQTYNIKKLDPYFFTKEDLININIIGRLEEIKSILASYYLICKGKKYLNDISVRRSITILRQILREFKYKIVSKEKYNNGKKYICYKIVKNTPLSLENLILNFD